jgi:hypothetical protein
VKLLVVGTDGPGRTFAGYRDVRVGLQVRKEVVDVVRGDVPRAEWAVEVSVDDAGVLRGPAIHGGREERFLYLSWLDGEQMFRRAKLQLDAVPAALVAKASAKDRVLVAELSMRDVKGEPICASVRPPRIRWSVARSSRP